MIIDRDIPTIATLLEKISLNAREFFQSLLSDRLTVSLLSVGAITYAVIKGISYSSQCGKGLQIASPKMPKAQRIGRAMGLGIVRLLIGLSLGWAPIVFLSWRFGLMAYLILYIPARWFEWGIMQMIMSPDSRSTHGFLFGQTDEWKSWRKRGIFLSYLSDISILTCVLFIILVMPGYDTRI